MTDEEFKCPYCEKSYKMKHLLVNHIRQSSGDHGAKYHFPDDYKERMGEDKPNEDQKATTNNGDQQTEEDTKKTMEETNISTEQEIIKVDPPEIQVVKDYKCPDCGTPKSEWITTREAHNHDINLNYNEIAEFDYVCPKCNELIKTK